MDGNCQYRALGIVCSHFKEDDHLHLRQMAYGWCKDHQQDLNLTDEEVEKISQPREWGTDITLRALADCLKITIKVAVLDSSCSPDPFFHDSYTFLPISGPSHEVVYLFFELSSKHFSALEVSDRQSQRSAFQWSTGNTQVERQLNSELSRSPRKKRRRADDDQKTRRNHKRQKTERKTPFWQLPEKTQLIRILTPLVGEPSAALAISGTVLGEESVETQPELVPNRLLELCDKKEKKLFSFFSTKVKACFTDDAWASVEQLLRMKQATALWNCLECVRVITSSTKSIRCDLCLDWAHLTCTPYKKGPRGSWFCDKCK